MRHSADGPIRHVYVHFPFCARKCPYCDFNSHAGREGETDVYIDALLDEAGAWGDVTRPETIFVGGGTPTHCDATQLGRYLVALRDVLCAGGQTEFTVEANPGSISEAKVHAMLEAGVNRVSLGAQSFDDRHLGTLGRIHDADATRQSVEVLRSAGMPRFSLDLILAIPGQRLEEQAEDLDQALALGPEHVSAYVLTFEEGTIFTRRMRAGKLPPPSAARELDHLHLAVERLEAGGLARYEISNFARPGAESRHNLAYWRNREWLGLGAGAHSHVGGRRWKNVDDPAAYARAVSPAGSHVEWRESNPPEMQLFESLMMGLRLTEGVDLEELSRRHGIEAGRLHEEAIDRHVEGGLLELEGARLRLTRRGLDLANAVIVEFLPDEIPALSEPVA